MKKFELDRSDDVTALLRDSAMAANPALAEMLLSLGANPGSGEEGSALRSHLHTLAWALEGIVLRQGPRPIVEVLCLFAARGVRWSKVERDSFGGLRRGLAKAGGYEAISVLNELVRSGLVTNKVFRKLMSNPRTEGLLRLPIAGCGN